MKFRPCRPLRNARTERTLSLPAHGILGGPHLTSHGFLFFSVEDKYAYRVLVWVVGSSPIKQRYEQAVREAGYKGTLAAYKKLYERN